MDENTHAAATNALDTILRGRSVVGMYFTFSNLWFNYADNPGGEDAYLRIDNGWALMSGSQSGSPVPSELNRDYRELARVAAGLAKARVESVSLDEKHAHLWVIFDSGDTLFINGWHDQFESWELSSGHYLLVALAAGDLAIWTPDQRREHTSERNNRLPNSG